MEKNLISNAFTFMFKDNDWKYKLIILALLEFPSIYLSYLIQFQKESINLPKALILLALFLITVPFVTGYIAKCTQNIIFSSSNETNILPNWEDNFIGYFVLGIKLSLAILPSCILFCILPAVIPALTIPVLMNIFGKAGALIIIPCLIPTLVFMLIFNALYKIYCIEFKSNSFFAWKTAKNIILSNLKLYIIVLIAPAVIKVLISLITKSLMHIIPSGVGFSIFHIIFMPYVALFSIYLIGNLDKNNQQNEVFVS